MKVEITIDGVHSEWNISPETVDSIEQYHNVDGLKECYMLAAEQALSDYRGYLDETHSQ